MRPLLLEGVTCAMTACLTGQLGWCCFSRESEALRSQGTVLARSEVPEKHLHPRGLAGARSRGWAPRICFPLRGLGP